MPATLHSASNNRPGAINELRFQFDADGTDLLRIVAPRGFRFGATCEAKVEHVQHDGSATYCYGNEGRVAALLGFFLR